MLSTCNVGASKSLRTSLMHSWEEAAKTFLEFFYLKI